VRRRTGTLCKGEYGRILVAYLDRFSRQQIYLIASEKLNREPIEVTFPSERMEPHKRAFT